MNKLRDKVLDNPGIGLNCMEEDREHIQEIYDDAELRKRIAAQLDTCTEAGVRHVVLSAFGCGAFQNPSPIVAGVYKQEVLKRKEHFDVVAFAIFHAGYGPDNFGVFRDIFEGA